MESNAYPVMPRSVTSASAEAVIAPKLIEALRIAAPMPTVRSRQSTMRMAQRLQNPLRRIRLAQHLGAKRRQRVVDRVADRGRRADGPGLTDALGAEQRPRHRRLDVVDEDV